MTVKDGLVWYWDLDSADAAIVDQHNGLSLSRVGTTTTVTGGAPDGGNCISVGNAVGKYRNSSVAKTINYDVGFSVNIWAFSTGQSFFGNWLINHRNNPSNLPDNRYFQLVARPVASPDSADVWAPADSVRSAAASPAAGIDQWVMFTLVDNGSSTQLYRNGVLVATSSTTLATRNTGPASFGIGGSSWDSGVEANLNHRGRVSMAGVWDRPLTADEVTWLYNSGAGRRYNSLQFGERDVGGEVLWICPSLDDIGNGTLIARDLTTNRNHAALTNMETGDWLVNTASGGVRALDFDGVNEYVSTVTPVQLNSSFTMSAWVNLSRIQSNNSIVDAIFNIQSTSYANYWANLATIGNNLEFALFDGANNPRAASSLITANTWVHVCGTRDVTTDTVNLYINGVLRASVTDTTLSVPPHSQVTIGGQVAPSGRYARGMIDDARIFNRLLSTTEIAALASQRGYQPPAYTGLGGEVLWVCPTLDSLGNGTLLARDLTYQRRHGTLTNMDAATDWVADTANGGVRALDFDGVNDLVSSSVFDFLHTDPLVFSMWARPVSFATNQCLVATWRYLVQSGWQVNILSGGTIAVTFLDANAINYYLAQTTATLNLNQWNHVCVTSVGGNASGIRVWLNGTEVSTTPSTFGTGNPGVMASTQLWIGRRQNGSGDLPLLGRIDDLRLFKRDILNAEITALASKRGYQPITSVRRRRNIGSYGI